jgi:Cu2+-exporting ATPase
MSLSAERLDLSTLARVRDDDTREVEFAVEGISCGGCIARIEKAVNAMPGISGARVNFTNRRMTVGWAKDSFDPQAVVNTLARLGYPAHPFSRKSVEDSDAAESKMLLRYLAVAGFAAMNIMLLSVSVWSGNAGDITPETRDLFHWVSGLIALPAVAYAGQPFFASAWTALRARSVNMDVPISLGVLLAVGMSLVETIGQAQHAYFDSAVMLLFFLLCGRYLDRAMRRRTRAVAGNLAAMRAETAHRVEADGTRVQVPASALEPGDFVLVRTGERIPADGVVTEGHSDIDESLVTGETTRRPVKPGDDVYSGSVNFSGQLKVRITAAGGHTLLDEIERLLDGAVRSKSRYVQLADRAARLYAPFVHATAALTLAGWLLAGQSLHDSLIAAIAVLIITCPCALALAVPAVQVVASGRLFRNGVILNCGDAIERLAAVDTVIFDKTGTLTLPEARVVNAAVYPRDLVDKAACLALSSNHPLAAALARESPHARPMADVREELGRGLVAEVEGIEIRLGSPAFCGTDAGHEAGHIAGGSSVLAFRDGDRTALFRVSQLLRPDARAVINELRALGIELRILSGDHPQAVKPVAEALGISDWSGNVRPRDKVDALRHLRAAGRNVLMVGDGINDAPALAEASVSMSPATAAAVSQVHAGALFLGAPLRPVVDAVLMARRARALMTQNLLIAVIYNAIAVPVAIAGLVTPLIAALAMSGSSILVTVNALRMVLAPDSASATRTRSLLSRLLSA